MPRSSPAVIARLPGTPGVYRFRDAHDRALYIGRATALRSRVASYWSDLADRGHLVPMVARITRIEAVSCDSVHEAAWLERNLLQATLPPWNRTPGGQEKAVYIRMSATPANPGLSVVHETEPADQVRYFGPYLGGLKVRRAVTALHRILPLPYAKAPLASAERDLARMRGVASEDRTALIGSLTAILERQPAAVSWARRQLEQLRDHAAARLAYEFAARIRDEIDALGWLSCPQRVTTMDATNLTIAGWSGGMLVQFLICGGRLCHWTQGPSTLPSARPALAATPAAWRDFTRRNAELAASLAQHPQPRRSGPPSGPSATQSRAR